MNYSKRHWKLKEKAQKLRSQGLSYKEISRKVPVAKSTLSLWCRSVPLTKEQQKRLWEKRDYSLKGIQAIQKMFWKKRCEAFEEGLKMIKTITDHRFISGLMLYWGEGDKKIHCGIANSDEKVIIFMIKWFKLFFDIEPHSIKLYLHLHSGQNEEFMKKYWSRLTGVPIKNFNKSFIKPEGSGYRKNVLYHGTVKICPGGRSTYLLFKILGGIAGYLHKVIDEPINIEKWISKLPYVDMRP